MSIPDTLIDNYDSVLAGITPIQDIKKNYTWNTDTNNMYHWECSELKIVQGTDCPKFILDKAEKENRQLTDDELKEVRNFQDEAKKMLAQIEGIEERERQKASVAAAIGATRSQAPSTPQLADHSEPEPLS